MERVTLPGALGEFTVLRRHAPIISALVKGEVKYLLKDGKEEKVAIASGFAEVKKTKCRSASKASDDRKRKHGEASGFLKRLEKWKTGNANLKGIT